MALIVQKYGGTSVGSIDRIKNVANRIKVEREKGHQVVAVISAMGGETDKLISLASELSQHPVERELDVLLSSGEQQSIALLAIALNEMGIKAVSATGRQAGILTSGSHTRGRIERIDPTLINRYLEADQTVVIAGFQGITEEGMIHTLGRGGSDLSAIAVASSIKAELCQILTDVDGVYTPPIPEWLKKRESSPKSLTTNFSNSPLLELRLCNHVRSNSPKNMASNLKLNHHSIITRGPLSPKNTKPWNQLSFAESQSSAPKPELPLPTFLIRPECPVAFLEHLLKPR